VWWRTVGPFSAIEITSTAVDAGCGTDHPFQMAEAPTFQWRGWGRWLSFAAAAYMIVMGVAVLLIALQRDYSPQLEASAGWDLFLGLLFGGVVASNNRRAPLLAAVIAALMAVRVIGALMIGHRLALVSIDVLQMLIAAVAAFDLQRQAKAM